MNFASIFAACYAKVGLKQYYVELEYQNNSASIAQLESVKRSYGYLAHAGFVK